jgi:xanthine/CO dehydrogenase XdhC/CoxF family maturation factor
MSNPREEIVETMAGPAPAGLDIGAITPEEIALATLADIVREWRRGAREALGQTGAKRARRPRKAALVDAICH